MFEQRPTVMKFGGTSVADARAFSRVAALVGRDPSARPVVVVSAMSRFTDALVKAAQAASEGYADAAAASLEEHLARHSEVARELLGGGEAEAFGSALDDARREVGRALRALAADAGARPALRDLVLSCGERLSSLLLAAVLRARGLDAAQADARRCVVTDEEFGRATPVKDETERCTRAELGPLLSAGRVPVVGGFIASTRGGQTTTLGRGGSDFTAALVGAALGAREIQIWTDVSGVMTADPRVVPEARTIPVGSPGTELEFAL